MRRGFSLLLIVLLSITALSCRPISAAVELGSPFADNMVLQREKPVPVWGTAQAGETVTVTFENQQKNTTADARGKWSLKLDPLKAGGPFELKARTSDTDAVVVRNVLVGEVWLCSGQSNMAMTVRVSKDSREEIAAANYPNLRMVKVPTVSTEQPVDRVELTWQPCSPTTVADFSAVAYFFGRELHQKLNVPIGIINSSFGSTVVESWTSRPTLEKLPEAKPILERYAGYLQKFPVDSASYPARLAEWERLSAEAEKAGKPAPRRPTPPIGPGHRAAPSGLYNAMIHPLLPYAIRGVVWYQGEFNVPRAYQYRALLPALITDWRQAFGQGDFPFYIVQLPNYLQPAPAPGESKWAELREAQALALSLPNTGLATTIDLGEAKDIHPKNKQDVGKRVALLALAKTYNQPIAYSGPVFESMKINGSKVELRFQHADGLKTLDGSAPTGFAIAGNDKKWFAADAIIQGQTIVVSSPHVAVPVAVRYAWADNPSVNLYNAAGLPARPFRTDDWPGMTTNLR